MALLALMLVLAMALLAIVDVQTKASDRDQRGDSSFNGAESVLNGAVASLGSQDGWVSALDTSTAPCGTISYTAANTQGTVFGANLEQFVTRALGTSAGTWKVNICGMASATESWDESYLTTRVAHSSLPIAETVWVRAQTTARGERRAVVARADLKTTPIALPTQYAIATGSLGTDDIGVTSNTLIGGLLGGILGTGGKMILDSNAKLGVRCGLLNLVDPSPDTRTLCLAGTLASVDDFSNLLGTGALTDTLGINRFDQLPSNQTAIKAQLDAYKLAAAQQGNYFAAVADNASCLPAATTNASIVYIETVAGGGTCRIDAATPGAPGRKAAILIVGTGKILVHGDNNANNYPAGPTDNPTFTGVIYAANQNDSGANVVTIDNRGWVRGAVFVDGPGKTWIDPPNVSVTTALCNSLPLAQKLACQLLSGLQLVDYLINALGLGPLVAALLPQISNYTAVQRDTTVINAAKSNVPNSANMGSGTFRQLAPN
jgi:hypothetical protein